MQTSLRVEGANCPICFNATLDDLARLDGVRAVHGSIGEPCIQIEHDDVVALDVLAGTIRNRLHSVEMFANEIEMMPVEPVAFSTCTHHHHAGEGGGGASG